MKNTLITILFLFTLLIPLTLLQVRVLEAAQIDIALPFSLAERVEVKSNLGLTASESVILDAVLDGESPNSIGEIISILIKQANEKGLSSDDFKYITGLDGEKRRDIKDSIKYLARKKVSE